MTEGQKARRQRQRDKRRCRIVDENRSAIICSGSGVRRRNGYYDRTFADAVKNIGKKGCELNEGKICRYSL